MSKIKEGRVQFDRNGVASVSASDLLEAERVKEQYLAARRIVKRHRDSVRALSKRRAVRQRG